MSAVCGLALCAAAPASADAPYPETLYIWATAHKSVSLVWSFADMGHMNVGVDCNDRHWYMRKGPAVNAANHFRMRFKGKIRLARSAPEPGRLDRGDPRAAEGEAAPVRGLADAKRARIFIKHAKCFPHGKRLTLHSP